MSADFGLECAHVPRVLRVPHRHQEEKGLSLLPAAKQRSYDCASLRFSLKDIDAAPARRFRAPFRARCTKLSPRTKGLRGDLPRAKLGANILTRSFRQKSLGSLKVDSFRFRMNQGVHIGAPHVALAAKIPQVSGPVPASPA